MNPRDYGFDFDAYRPLQLQALNRATTAASRKRLVGIQAGTGFGKTLFGATLARQVDYRSGILVSSRALEDQYMEDTNGQFVNIRGRSNYECLHYRNCDEGRHRKCGYQRPPTPSCPYILRLQQAQQESFITNYRYFVEMSRRGAGLGTLERLVCDEAHHLVDALTAAAAVVLDAGDLKWFQDSRPSEEVSIWAERARGIMPSVMNEYDAARAGGYSASHIRRLEDLFFKISTLAEASDESWVVDEQKDGSFKFEPIDAGLFGKWITEGAVDVFFTSATLRPILFEFLNISKQDFTFIEMGSDFPPEKAPVYVMPKVRVDWKMSDNDKILLRSTIDNWISRRLDRKGVIHSVSYDRAEWLKATSRYGDKMITHGRGQARQGVEEFRRADAPSILVSPAVDTGFDFPGDAASWQVLMKLPRMSAEGSKRLLARRKERYKKWSEYEVAQRFEQMCGRVNRSKDEIGETVIFDGHADYFLNNNKELFTSHLNRRLRRVQLLPAPLSL